MKAWTGWGAFYRRGGRLCQAFDHHEAAKAFVGTGYVLRLARVRVTELPARRGKR
jgi:hypothetical protein